MKMTDKTTKAVKPEKGTIEAIKGKRARIVKYQKVVRK